jgi:NTE family protein
MRIGLALSGGGVRATVFHLGVLARLACDPSHKLESVKAISTVSGGSLATGLVFSKSGNSWPTSEGFITTTLPSIAEVISNSTLQFSYGWRAFVRVHRWFGGKAHIMGNLIRKQWGIDLSLKDLPDEPYWYINASTFETGKNWRFEKGKMGDYKAGYVLTPDFPVSSALGASAAFPRLIGPLTLRTKKYNWYDVQFNGKERSLIPKQPAFRKLRLWDGGAYDNLGTEALYKPGPRTESDKLPYNNDLDFLVVSDASKPLGIQRTVFQKELPFYAPAVRLVYIATDQVRSLRVRTFLNQLRERPGTGVFIKIGNHTGYIAEQAVKYGFPRLSDSIIESNLGREETSKASDVKTTLKRLPETTYTLLFRHGFEVANATLAAYCPSEFTNVDLPENLKKLFQAADSDSASETQGE